jgi:hypothetical protein
VGGWSISVKVGVESIFLGIFRSRMFVRKKNIDSFFGSLHPADAV